MLSVQAVTRLEYLFFFSIFIFLNLIGDVAITKGGQNPQDTGRLKTKSRQRD